MNNYKKKIAEYLKSFKDNYFEIKNVEINNKFEKLLINIEIQKRLQLQNLELDRGYHQDKYTQEQLNFIDETIKKDKENLNNISQHLIKLSLKSKIQPFQSETNITKNIYSLIKEKSKESNFSNDFIINFKLKKNSESLKFFTKLNKFLTEHNFTKLDYIKNTSKIEFSGSLSCHSYEKLKKFIYKEKAFDQKFKFEISAVFNFPFLERELSQDDFKNLYTMVKEGRGAKFSTKMEREEAALHSGGVFAFDVPFSAQDEYTIDLLHQNLIDEIESFYNNSPSHIIKPFKENGKFRNAFDKIDLVLTENPKEKKKSKNKP